MHIRKGFTLVELLIVVAVIGILAAIAIPQFNKYKARSYLATLQSDLKNAYTSAQAYLTDNAKATVTDIGTLQRKGYTQTRGINVVSVNISMTSGSIVLSSGNLDSSVATTNQGSVDFNGAFTVPALK